MLGKANRTAGVCLRVCLWLLVLVCLLAGCSNPVATVNGRRIDQKAFDALVRERTKEAGQLTAPEVKKLKESVLDAMITEALILEETARLGMTVTEEETGREVEGIRKSMGEAAFRKALKDRGISLDTLRKRTKEQMLLSRFTEALLGKEKVADEEVRRYYTDSPRPFLKPAKVLMNMIECGDEATARAIAAEIREKKTDFDVVAKRLSDEQKASVSGYGWVNPDLFSPGLTQGVRNLKNGQYGGPYRGKDKYYLVKMMDREKESIASFDEVKDSIRSKLLEEKRQTAFSRWIAEKRTQSKIEIHLN